jgi:hypothetical protein
MPQYQSHKSLIDRESTNTSSRNLKRRVALLIYLVFGLSVVLLGSSLRTNALQQDTEVSAANALRAGEWDELALTDEFLLQEFRVEVGEPVVEVGTSTASTTQETVQEIEISDPVVHIGTTTQSEVDEPEVKEENSVGEAILETNNETTMPPEEKKDDGMNPEGGAPQTPAPQAPAEETPAQ